MKVLIIGSGGREHAMTAALSQSEKTTEIFAYPGSDAIFELASPLHSKKKSLSHEEIAELCKELGVELVCIGPEAPLVEGLSDFLRQKDFLVFGPDQKGAMLEGDKVFSKNFMNEYKVPTGDFHLVSDLKSLDEGLEKMKDLPFYVFKYKDLAGGKGVLVSKSKDEITAFAKSFGVTEEQQEVVGYLEEPLEGWELSCICLVNETGYEICPILQDHKRLEDKDLGPNTGGMGVAGPLKLSQDLLSEIKTTIIENTVLGFKKRNMTYRGVIYIGVMVTDAGPKVLEYNVRFGDPEAQLIFPLVGTDWGQTMRDVSAGKSFAFKAKEEEEFGCCVVLAAEGYPTSPKKGVEIKGLEKVSEDLVYHAGTKKNEEGLWVTNGGRVLNVCALENDLESAVQKAYEVAQKIQWNKMQYRKDIGSKVNNP